MINFGKLGSVSDNALTLFASIPKKPERRTKVKSKQSEAEIESL